MRTPKLVPLACLLAFTSASASANINIVFDYTYDAGFFTEERKDLMESVASVFEARITDTLDAITTQSGDVFSLSFHNPSSSNINSFVALNSDIAENEYRIYLGAYSMGSNLLGNGGAGGFSTNLSDTEISRGQDGYSPLDANSANDTDFAPWGGAISFNSARSDWDFNIDDGLTGFDFYSVALHETAHALGFGTADSWVNQVDGICNSGPCSLDGQPLATKDLAHWMEGTTSFVDGLEQEAAMDPTLSKNTRKNLTDLDWAGLSAIGWQVTAAPVPEPETWAMLLAGLGLVGFAAKRRRR
jgi:hypothetical protein